MGALTFSVSFSKVTLPSGRPTARLVRGRQVWLSPVSACGHCEAEDHDEAPRLLPSVTTDHGSFNIIY
ncbi:MAG: hypothetical protein MZV63_32690 [Marinilabiliales bacterium]|nr:hypothetical protein [Marinilabiliales bacterium]